MQTLPISTFGSMFGLALAVLATAGAVPADAQTKARPAPSAQPAPTAQPAQAPAPAPRWPAYLPQRTDGKFGRQIFQILDPNKLRGRVHEEVVAELLRLGPDAIPSLFAYLSGTLEGPEPEYSPAPELTEEQAAALPEPLREDVLVIDTLKRMPKPRVVAQVASAMLHGNVDVKLVGMRLLDEIGDAQAIDAWLDVMTALEPIHLQRAYVQSPCESALASVLVRDDQAFTRLVGRLKGVEARVLPCIVRGVATSERARGVDVLLGLLGRDTELDLVVLKESGRLAEATVGSLTDQQLTFVRPYATDDDWRIRREALGCLGRVRDYRSFEAFLAALGDEQRLVGQTALWCLKHLSNQDLGEDANDWRTWYERELSWSETEGARWMQGLEDDDPARIVEAARELSGHVLFMHDTAHALAPLLQHDDANVATAIAGVLGSLGSRSAVPALVQALGSSESKLKTAALVALQELTGKQLPADPAAWSAYVQG